jgi:plasmid replication initiation protein
MVIYSYRGDYMNKNYLVTKSNYFIMNSSYDLSLEEQKIILTLASMVQPTDEEFKIYKFKINEFMELVGVDTKTKYTQIPKITKELMKKVFEIEEGKKLIQVAWLSSVVYEKGTGYVELEFSPRLKPYMLKLNTVFTQYKLGNILNMKSKYSPRIYELLKCNEFKKQGYIEIEVDELRKILKTEDMYHQYQDFKRKVVIQAQKELKKISDISFEFEEIKTGRKVTSIRFYIKTNKTDIKANDEVCVTIEGKSTNEGEKCRTSLINEVKAIFKEDIEALEAKYILDTAKGDINIIKEKYAQAENVVKIDNIVGWMLKALKEDYKTAKKKVKVGSFNDYEQRAYDFDDLEKKLLDWDNSETDEVAGNEYQQLSI